MRSSPQVACQVDVRVQMPRVDGACAGELVSGGAFAVLLIARPVGDKSALAVEIDGYGDPGKWVFVDREELGGKSLEFELIADHPAPHVVAEVLPAANATRSPTRLAAAGVLNDVPAHTPRPDASMSLPSDGHSCKPVNIKSTLKGDRLQAGRSAQSYDP